MMNQAQHHTHIIKPKQIDANQQVNNQIAKKFNLSTKTDKLTSSKNGINSNNNKVPSINISKHHSSINSSTSSTIVSNSSKLGSNVINNSKNTTANKNHTGANRPTTNHHNNTQDLTAHRNVANSSTNRASKSTSSNAIAKSNEQSKHPCQLCELNFYDIERLNFHLVKIHKVDQRISLVQCFVENCEEKFKKRMQLVDHLNDIHNLGVIVIRKTVDNLDEFTEWKNRLEQETGYVWIQNNRFLLNNLLRKTYICNRSASNGSKIYSLHGLTTINNHSTFCLSSIKVTESEDNKFLIEFIETHNHDEN